jgi:hypothetical protein
MILIASDYLRNFQKDCLVIPEVIAVYYSMYIRIKKNVRRVEEGFISYKLRAF